MSNDSYNNEPLMIDTKLHKRYFNSEKHFIQQLITLVFKPTLNLVNIIIV